MALPPQMGLGMNTPPPPMQNLVMTGAAPNMMDGMPDMSQVGPCTMGAALSPPHSKASATQPVPLR